MLSWLFTALQFYIICKYFKEIPIRMGHLSAIKLVKTSSILNSCNEWLDVIDLTLYLMLIDKKELYIFIDIMTKVIVIKIQPNHKNIVQILGNFSYLSSLK